tara:strand:+ start:334 stop:1476 length:1143 start_codon:yes stop_codon:yes gene_type:complete
MVIVGYVVGAFDKYHHGHRFLLERCKQQCDLLVIGVHTDVFVESYKRKTFDNQEKRYENIKNSQLADEIVIIGDDHGSLIRKYNVTKMFHGDDWEINSYKKQIGYYEDGLDKLGVELILLPYTKGISTTMQIKNEMPNMSNYQEYLFDLDNTLLLNHKAMPFASELIKNIRSIKKKIKVVTNNNRYSPKEIKDSLNMAGIEIEEDEIYSSLRHAHTYLMNNYSGKKVYVWGTESSNEWLTKNNINIDLIENAEVIVVLYKNDYCYSDLVKLVTKCNEVPYIIGNVDYTYPDNTLKLPDTGCTEIIIKNCTGKDPVLVCGKTNPSMLDVHPESLMIGDSLRTDKVFADNANIDFFHLHENGDISHLGVVCDYIDNTFCKEK